MDTLTEVPTLPHGYQEVKLSGQSITLSRADIPWLSDETRRIGLAQVRLEDGTEFYLGSALAHKTLQAEAENLGRQGLRAQEQANQIFYKQLRSFVQTDQNPDVPKVQHPRTDKSIYYAKSPNGERTYFMRFDNIEGKRVIIRIAACSKNGQEKVLRVIATH